MVSRMAMVGWDMRCYRKSLSVKGTRWVDGRRLDVRDLTLSFNIHKPDWSRFFTLCVMQELLRGDLCFLMHHHFSHRHVRVLLLRLLYSLSKSLIMVNLSVSSDHDSLLDTGL